MFNFLLLEKRKLQRRNIANIIINILNKTPFSNKLCAFMIKTIHFTLPWYLFIFVFMYSNLNICLLLYFLLVLSLFLYIYFHGCFISYLEYKLYDKDFINVIDPYIVLFGYHINNKTRFYGTFIIIFIYLFVVSIVMYIRFLIN